MHTLSAILAVSSVAQIALTLVLARPLHSLTHACPQRHIRLEYARTRCLPQDDPGEVGVSLRFCVYVDDIAMHVYADKAEVATTLTRANLTLIDELQGGLQMTVSRRSHWSTEGDGKPQVAISERKVRNAVSTTMERLGIRIRAKASHLAVPFRTGGKTRPPHRSQQMGSVRKTTGPSSPHGV